MAVELEGLEFQIEAKSDEATKGVDALSSTFSKLKTLTKGGLGLNSSVKQLTNLNKALEGFHSEKLEKLSNALGSLSGAKSTIPSTLPKRISELSTSLQNLRDEDIDRLERVSNVLHGMGDLSNVRIPRVNVPTTGVAPTMTTPGNTATDAIDSGVEQATNSFLGGGEAGKEAVLPLESHTEWMDTLADKVRSGLPDGNSDIEGYYDGVQKILEHMENLERTMNNMANDMNRQANKKEQTTVQIGNRVTIGRTYLYYITS